MSRYTASWGGQRQAQIVLGERLASGATGDIYRVTGRAAVVAKIYKASAHPAQYEAKIEEMIQRPPHLPPLPYNGRDYVQIAWPQASLRDSEGKFRGFLMPEIDVGSATELENILQKSSRQHRKLPEFYGGRLLLAANLASLTAEMHARSHYFIDMKPLNVRFYPGAWYLAILDTDGFSVQGTRRWPAGQFSDDYIAPEAKGLAPEKLGVEQDLFALAVIVFQLLNNGIHPYQGSDARSGAPTTKQERIFAKLYAYGPKPPPDIRPAMASIHEYLEPSTRALFDRAFTGHPTARPTAQEWRDHLNRLITSNIFVKCRNKPNEHGHFSRGCGLCNLDAIRNNVATHVVGSGSSHAQMSGASLGTTAHTPTAHTGISLPLASAAQQVLGPVPTIPTLSSSPPQTSTTSSLLKFVGIGAIALLVLAVTSSLLSDGGNNDNRSRIQTSTSTNVPLVIPADMQPPPPSITNGNNLSDYQAYLNDLSRGLSPSSWKIDWQRLKYPTGRFCFESPHNTIRQPTTEEERLRGFTGDPYLFVSGPILADLTGDGREEAIIRADCGTNAIVQALYIFTWNQSQLSLLSLLELGSGAFGGIADIAIDRGRLKLTVFAGRARCCPEYLQETVWQWQGQHPRQIGPTVVRRFSR